MKDVTLEQCNSPELWDSFVRQSSNGSPFCESWFSRCVSPENVYYFFRDGEEILAALLLNLHNDIPFLPEYSVYHSVCFAEKINNMTLPEKGRAQFKILSSLVNLATRKYPALHLSLHPTIMDVRPFLWHNYNSSSLGAFKTDIRYTAVLGINEYQNQQELLNLIRKGRKTDYNKFKKLNAVISEGVDVEQFLSLYTATFARQQQKIGVRAIEVIRSILLNLNPERGFVLTAKSVDDIPLSAIVVLLGRYSAYSLFMANDPDYRHYGANSALIIEAAAKCKELGIAEFDFVGANSPNRAEFKIGFNSALRLYFSISPR